MSTAQPHLERAHALARGVRRVVWNGALAAGLEHLAPADPSTVAPDAPGRPARRPTGPPRRVRLRLVAAFAAAAVLAASAGLMIALALAREYPAWWRSVDLNDPGTHLAAEAVENGVSRELHRPRVSAAPGEEAGAWTVRLKTREANAWLNARLPRWIANQHDDFRWPAELAELQVNFREGRIDVAGKVWAGEPAEDAAGGAGGRQGRVFSVTLAPEIRADGSFWLRAVSVQAGRLKVPASWILGGAVGAGAATRDETGGTVPGSLISGRIPEALRDLPEARAMLDAFAGRAPVLEDPTIKLSDGRRVRLLDVRTHEGALLITCRTDPRAARASAE